jgi:hypothetical protein
MSRLRLVGGQVRAQRVAPGGVGERRARHAKDGQLRRQTASQEEVKQRRQRLLLRQVARRAEHNHCRAISGQRARKQSKRCLLTTRSKARCVQGPLCGTRACQTAGGLMRRGHAAREAAGTARCGCER